MYSFAAIAAFLASLSLARFFSSALLVFLSFFSLAFGLMNPAS